MLPEPLKQAKSRKNPAQTFLENHGVVFPRATDTNKKFSDLVCSNSLQTTTEPEMLTEDETAKETAQMLLSLNSITS